jgi:hypothetical protein
MSLYDQFKIEFKEPFSKLDYDYVLLILEKYVDLGLSQKEMGDGITEVWTNIEPEYKGVEYEIYFDDLMDMTYGNCSTTCYIYHPTYQKAQYYLFLVDIAGTDKYILKKGFRNLKIIEDSEFWLSFSGKLLCWPGTVEGSLYFFQDYLSQKKIEYRMRIINASGVIIKEKKSDHFPGNPPSDRLT